MLNIATKKRSKIKIRYSQQAIKNTLLLCVLLAGFSVFGQKNLILKGTVKDAKTGEPIAFAAVELIHSTDGAYTDTLGQFTFNASAIGDSLRVTYLGYQPYSCKINLNNLQKIDIRLIPAAVTLGEMLFVGDANPGRTFMKKVIERNRENDPARFKRLDARRWTRSEVDAVDPVAAADVSGKTAAKGGMLFGKQARIFEQMRSKQDSFRGEIPLFFAEKLANYAQTNHPFAENEELLAVKTTKLESDRFLEPLARCDAGNISLYASRVLLFGKTFVSPIGNEALGFYNFYIQDSTAQAKGGKLIRLQVIPKNWYGNVFVGTIEINDSSYALCTANLHLSKNANLNFIDSLSLIQVFSPAHDLENKSQVLTLYKSALTLQYELGLELIGIPLPSGANSKRLISRITVVFDSVQVNDINRARLVSGAMVTALRHKDSGASEAFWKQKRPSQLNAHENAIYHMADSLRIDPQQRLKDKLFSTVGSGAYYFEDKVYLGPLGSLVSYNRIEGTRFRIGFRTMEGFSKKIGFYGHLAYGVKDNRYKGSIGAKYLWKTKPYAKTELLLSSDYNALSQWYDEIDHDGFFNSILRKRIPYRQTFQEQINLTHDQQVGSDFFFRGGLSYRSIDPTFDYRFPNPRFSENLAHLVLPHSHKVYTAEASIGLRFAWHERSRIFNYDRLPIDSKLPVLTFLYTRGFKTLNADFSYHKINFGISHTTHITPKTYLFWNFDIGKIYGVLPSLLLQIPRGNNTYVMSRYVFNTMLPYEFFADRYVSLTSRLSLGGIIFDRIPLLQRLGWRERLTYNAFLGDLSPANQAFNREQHFTPLRNKHPFMEAGFGVENIFHLFSIDFIHRLSYLHSTGARANGNGIYIGMNVLF
jgi:hypothetical protein